LSTTPLTHANEGMKRILLAQSRFSVILNYDNS